MTPHEYRRTGNRGLTPRVSCHAKPYRPVELAFGLSGVVRYTVPYSCALPRARRTALTIRCSSPTACTYAADRFFARLPSLPSIPGRLIHYSGHSYRCGCHWAIPRAARCRGRDSHPPTSSLMIGGKQSVRLRRRCSIVLN